MSSNIKKYDVAIIGGGPGGIFASYFGSIKGLKNVLIEANGFLGGQPITLYGQKSVYDYPTSYGIKAYELTEQFVSQLKKSSNSEIMLNTKLLDIEQNKDNSFNLKLSDQKMIQANYVIIAIGPGIFKTKKLEVDKIRSSKTIDYKISNLSDYTNKNVIVLGGGDAAVDWANEIAINSKPKSITIIHRRDTFRASGDNVKALKTNGVKIILNQIVTQIDTNQITLKNQLSNKLTTLEYDRIIVQYGQDIEMNHGKIFQILKKDQANRIIVDLEQQTTIPNIYAIGNACTYPNKSITIISAQGEATRAITSILNKKLMYDQK